MKYQNKDKHSITKAINKDYNKHQNMIHHKYKNKHINSVNKYILYHNNNS
jgi:hypothetical protein